MTTPDVGAFLHDLPEPFADGSVLSHQENRLVVRATDARNQLPVVLKVLVPPFDAEERFAFAREYLLLDAVAHPYWVDVGKFGETSSGVYFTLEHVKGEPLSFLKLRGWTPEVVEIARRVLSGLDALHRLGFAQVDLKPEQVLVDWSGRESLGWTASREEVGASLDLRLLDLGLAAPFGQPMRPSGTLGYMAPEILRQAKQWDGRADLFAFGAILFELLYGRPVFTGRTARELLQQQLEGIEVVFPRDTFVPPELETFLLELLSSDPEQRPPTAWDVWVRIRDLVPHRGATELPQQLTGSPEFTFRGREAEIAAFERWCADLEASEEPIDAVCTIRGEWGIGKRRLARRLCAVAQTRGWRLEEVGDGRDGQEAENDRIVEASHRLVGGSGFRSAISLDVEQTPILEARGRNEVHDGPAVNRLALGLVQLAHNDSVALAKGRGVESNDLARILAIHSLGSPGLLHALLTSVPPEMNFAVRHLPPKEIEAFLLDVECPGLWVQWARTLLDELGADEADWMVKAGILASGHFGDPTLSADRWLRTGQWLPELVSRRLMRLQERSARIDLPLWGKALSSASDERFRSAAKQLLEERTRSVGEDTVGLAWLSVVVEDPISAQPIVDSALEYLHARHLLSAEFELLAAAMRSGVVISEDRLVPVCTRFFAMGSQEPVPLPPVSYRDSDAIRFLEAWSLSVQDPEDGVRRLSASGILDSPVPEVREAAHLLNFRLDRRLHNRPRDVALTALRDAGFAGDPWEVRLAVGETSWLVDTGALAEAAGLAQSALAKIDSIPPPDRARALAQFGFVFFMNGELEQASECAERAYSVARECHFASQIGHALHVLGGIAYQRGDLPRVEEWSTLLFHEGTRHKDWKTCSLSLTNLALVRLQLGGLGDAIDSVRDALRLSERTNDPSIAEEAIQIEMLILTKTGQPEALRQLPRLVDGARGTRRAHYLSTLGEAQMLRGECQKGRESLEAAEYLFLDSESYDDVAALLAESVLLECTVGEEEKAIGAYRRLDSVFGKSSPLTQAMILLAEAEMASLGWLDLDRDSDEVERMLLRSCRLLEEKKLAYWSWRAWWRLGQIYRRRDASSAAERSLQTALQKLSVLAESIPEGRTRDYFLGLPASTAFMSDLSLGPTQLERRTGLL